jgi:hypothetical protein
MPSFLKLFKSDKDTIATPSKKTTESKPSSPSRSWSDFCKENEVEASEMDNEKASAKTQSDSHESRAEEPRVDEQILMGNSRWRNKDMEKKGGPGKTYKGGTGMADGMGRGY